MIDTVIISVDGYEYKIKFVNPISAELNDGECLGRIDYNNMVIFVNDSLEGIRLRETLIHELTHAYLHRHKHMYESFTNENVCEMFEMYADDVVNSTNEIIKKINRLE